MKLRTLAIAALGLLALPQMAAAAGWGQATGNVNLRTCGSVKCAKLGVIPKRARVWIKGISGGWYLVDYNGIDGYASGRYITTAVVGPPPPPPVFGPPPPPPPVFGRPPPPIFGYWQQPWWDPRYGAWYDGRRWYHSGRWYNQPTFYFGFRFGR